MIAPTNMSMIKDILSPNFKQEKCSGYDKFFDGKYEIIFESNRNIIVLDKTNNMIYVDLKIAHSALTNFKKLP